MDTTARVRGFSLLELMIVISIVAILASIAVPAYRNFILNSQRVNAVNDLMASLQLARSEALKLGSTVEVCPADSTGAACATTNTAWSGGWLVKVQAATPNPERILQLSPSVAPSLTVTSNVTSSYIFRPFGGRSTAGTITFCDSRGASEAKAITVSASGRARLVGSGSGLTCS